MKKTVTANIGGMAFHVDEDAYELLLRYLTVLKARYKDTEGHEEIINDIETRIAEILLSKISNAKQVITVEDINIVIEVMGKPEQFEDDSTSEKGKPTDNEENTTSAKKLYRDDEDKVIAGVCSGIGAYFNVDPLWIRIGFILTTLLFSTGLWIYLVLWVIVPKAKTTKEKLEMKGKKINISNIENSIREDIEDLKAKFHEFKDEAKGTLKMNKKKSRKGIEKFFHFIFSIIRFFVKSIAVILGIVFIFLGVFLFIGFISSFFNALPYQVGDIHLSISNISIPALLAVIFPSSFYIYVTIIGIIFLIATPLIMFIYYGFKLVFGFKYSNKIIGFTSFSLFIIGLALCLISTFQVVRNFSNKGVATERVISNINPQQKIRLDIKSESDETALFESEALQLGQLGLVTENGKNLLFGEPKVEILNNNKANEAEVLLLFSARGENKETAIKNAKSISYTVSMNDSIIKIPRYFTIKDNLKWRQQQLKVQIKVPEGSELIYSKNAREFLDKMN